jgi:hypothetical protein
MFLLMAFIGTPACAGDAVVDALRAADRHWLEQATNLPAGLEARDFFDLDSNTSDSKSVQVGTLRVVGSAISTVHAMETQFKFEIFNGTRKVAVSLFSGAWVGAQIVRLDPKTKFPQVLFLVSGGGSGGWVDVVVFDGGPDGTKWQRHEPYPRCCKAAELAHDAFEDGEFYILHLGRGDHINLGWSNVTAGYGARTQFLSFRGGRFVDGAPAEKLRRVYLQDLRWCIEGFAVVRNRMGGEIDLDDEYYQMLAVRYVQVKAGLAETAQAWAAVTGPLGFSRNRKFLQDARTALVKAKYVQDESELPLPAQ